MRIDPIRAMSCLRLVVVTAVLAALALGTVACSSPDNTQVAGAQHTSNQYAIPAQYSQQQQIAPQQQYGGAYQQSSATGDTQAGAEFARWVVDQDPRRQYLTDAIVRGDQSLGVKVQPNISRADLQQLLQALTDGMSRTFPGRPLEVIAYYQSGDKLAESLYDPRTGQANVQFVR
jgi:maltose-binding protein MalE